MKLLRLTTLLLMVSTYVAAQSRPVNIFLAGDSTMAPKLAEKRPETGWGEMLEQHFKSGKVRVENRAANGRSTRTFISEGKWQAIVDALQKGDYVFIQFGHNDQSKDKGERYTPPEDYRNNLVRFIGEVRAKKAHPVLMTPVMRRRFDKDAKFYDTHGEYPDIVRFVAREQGVPLIDMQRKSEMVIVRYGVEGSRKLFLQLKAGENPNYPNGIDDNTHFSPLGAEEMAKQAVEGIRRSKLGLRKYLR
ncbi:MAG TPA: rhamnogalacturonan acetylesterase [Pyrinomonadaceae bacterium]|nr:rhamnogalacturonan acetylesterase [Pyrinomonadaceae bacterium]